MLRTNGVYISESKGVCLYLYKNGKVTYKHLEIPPAKEQSPDSFIIEVRKKEFNTKEYWGDFEIKDGIFRSQVFTLNNERSCKRYIIENIGQIIDDSTIEMYYEFDTRADEEYFMGRYRLKFYQTYVKPDSSKAWFAKRKWYREGLHKSRGGKGKKKLPWYLQERHPVY